MNAGEGCEATVTSNIGSGRSMFRQVLMSVRPQMVPSKWKRVVCNDLLSDEQSEF